MVDSTITDLPDGGVARPDDLFAADRDGQTLRVKLPRGGSLCVLSPFNLSFPLIAAAPYAFAINGLAGLKVASGTMTLTIQINEVDVLGLTNISVTSTRQTVNATGLNAVAIDDEVTAVFSNVSDAVGLQFTMF